MYIVKVLSVVIDYGIGDSRSANNLFPNEFCGFMLDYHCESFGLSPFGKAGNGDDNELSFSPSSKHEFDQVYHPF